MNLFVWLGTTPVSTKWSHWNEWAGCVFFQRVLMWVWTHPWISNVHFFFPFNFSLKLKQSFYISVFPTISNGRKPQHAWKVTTSHQMTSFCMFYHYASIRIWRKDTMIHNVIQATASSHLYASKSTSNFPNFLCGLLYRLLNWSIFDREDPHTGVTNSKLLKTNLVKKKSNKVKQSIEII